MDGSGSGPSGSGGRARWVAVLSERFEDPAGRIVDVSGEERTIDGVSLGLVSVTFEVDDIRGEPYRATARLFLPEALRDDPDARLAVWFNCGYELPEAVAASEVAKGRVVVTSCEPPPGEVFPGSNPLARGPNTDVVLAHLVRSLPFVDPAGIVYTGGSAGGYAALLVAAEAFPVLLVATNSAVLNLVYQTAYFSDLIPRVIADPPVDQPLLPLLLGAMGEILDGARSAFGDDLVHAAWWEHSPLAHLDRLTGPAITLASTADFLVPIVQVGRDLASTTLAALPGEVRMAPEDLSDVSDVHRNLLHEVDGRALVEVVPVPEGAAVMQLSDLDLTLSTPATKVALPAWPAHHEADWLVVVVDEGPTVFGATHGRHQIQPDFDPAIESRLAATERIGVDQLTAAKLDQLLDRHRGVEWLAPGHTHLDRPAAERADVERSLRFFAGLSAQHAHRIVELYEAVAEERRVLPDALLEEVRARAG